MDIEMAQHNKLRSATIVQLRELIKKFKGNTIRGAIQIANKFIIFFFKVISKEVKRVFIGNWKYQQQFHQSSSLQAGVSGVTASDEKEKSSSTT